MSNETKWTPGPWAVDHEQNFEEISVLMDSAISDPCEYFTAHKWSCDIDWRERDEEAEANAHLIAAAPEMADYIKEKSDSGCEKATDLWRKCCGEI